MTLQKVIEISGKSNRTSELLDHASAVDILRSIVESEIISLGGQQISHEVYQQVQPLEGASKILKGCQVDAITFGKPVDPKRSVWMYGLLRR